MRDYDLKRVRSGEANRCAKKKRFASRQAADHFGADCLRRYGTRQEAYPCSSCDGWHLSHKHTYDERGFCPCGDFLD